MIGVGATPLVIHRPDTLEICGNGTYTPSPSVDEYTEWSNGIHTEPFYYILTQAILSIVLQVVIITSKINYICVPLVH